MKTRSLLWLAATLFATSAFAAAPGSDYTPMKIVQTNPVIYPQRLNDLGVREGEARVTVQIDEAGKLTDYLVTAYNHPQFAEAAVTALKKWRFEPAFLGGEARSATADLTFEFESQGVVVVNMTVSSYVEMRALQLMPNANSYSVCRLRELDKIPTPAKVVAPDYPADEAKQGRSGTVTVYFFIDEQGRVRLPAVSRESSQQGEAFAVAALDAVSQWRFEPPQSKGRPVLVAARQDFAFKPASATSTASKTANR